MQNGPQSICKFLGGCNYNKGMDSHMQRGERGMYEALSGGRKRVEDGGGWRISSGGINNSGCKPKN